MTQEKYDAFFAALRECLVPLIHKVTAAKQIREDFLHLEYPVEEQKKFMNEFLTYLHFDFSWGYQNESERPFTFPACENNCRTMTKYILNNVVSAIFSTVHEVRHAYCEHDVDPEYDDTILSEGISPDMYEPQSRLCENYLARTEVSWRYHHPRLKVQFPKQFGDVNLEDPLKAVNASKSPSIRTEADELTYPIHVLIRYEVKKGLPSETISTEGPDKAWNAEYKGYLDVDAPNMKVGILQDVYWSDDSFGYPPTYAPGTAFVAQLAHIMRKGLDVDRLFKNNQYDVVMGQLKEHIHKYNCRYDTPELMKLVAGEDFDVNYFLDYIEEKYTKLYQL